MVVEALWFLWCQICVEGIGGGKEDNNYDNFVHVVLFNYYIASQILIFLFILQQLTWTAGHADITHTLLQIDILVFEGGLELLHVLAVATLLKYLC